MPISTAGNFIRGKRAVKQPGTSSEFDAIAQLRSHYGTRPTGSADRGSAVD
jgi:hypothetical protein